MLSMGMAWHIITSKSGNQILFHNGGTGGYTRQHDVIAQQK